MKNKILLLTFLLLKICITNAQTPGNSLRFDGTNDYVTAALPAVFTNTTANDFTI